MREIGGAAWDLYEKERDQLRRRLAEQLRAQMGSIVGDREHADLLLVAADGRKLAAHRCILRQRAPGFYMRHVDPTVIAAKEFPSDQLLEVAVGDVDFAGLEFFIRSVYTDDEVEHLGAAERRHENDYDRDGSASRTSQHTYTMDDPPSTDDFDSERMPDEGTTEGAGDGTPMCGDSMAASEMSSASLRDDGGLLPLAQQVAAAPPTMTSFRQLACESPKKERPLGDVTPDSITQFVLSPDAVAPESPPTAADQMMGKFIRLDDIKDEEPMPVTTTQEKKQIFPMFIGLDLPTRPVSLGRELLPSVMTQSLPSPVNEPLSVRGRALAKRLSVTSLNSLTSIDISPSREAVEIFPQQEKEPCSRLGSDLLQMYLQQTDADITVRSENGDFRAHKCILAATSPYFQSLIAQAGATATIIDLKYSRNTVDFTLTFLYGGVTFMPPEIDVWEVMSIADHMKLAELTNVARLHLRAKICHLFHRPCAACVSAVFDALPQLHATVALADIFEEALAWQARYFGRIWKGRSFLHLNHRWQNLCFQYLVDNLNSETVIDVLLGCEKLQVTLPRSKASSASEAVAALVSDLLDSAMSFLASQLDQVIASQSFSNQGKGLALNLSLLEDVLPSVVHTVSADLGCRTLMRLYELLILLTEFEHDKANRQAPSTGVYSIETLIDEWNERFINLVRRLYELCDTHLLHHAASVVKCDGWNLLTPAMQQRIQNTGIFVEMRQARAPPPRLSSLNRTYKRSVSAGVPMGGASFYDRARSLERSRPLMVIPQVPETPEGRESKEREQSPRQMPAPAPAPSSPPSQQVVASQQIVVPQQVIASQPIVAPQQTVAPQQVAASQEVIVPQQLVASQKIVVTQQVVAPSPPPAPTSEQPAAPSEPVVQQAVAPIEPPASTAPPKQAQPPPPIDDPTPRETVVASSQPVVTGSPKSNKENKVAKKVPPAQTAPSAQPKLERQGTHTIIPAPAHPREQPVTTAAASVAKQDKPKSVVKPMPFVQAQPPPAPAAPSPKVAAPSPKVAASSPKVAASSPKVAARKSTITTPPANPTATPKISKTNNNTNIASRAPAVRSTTASQLPTSNLPTKRVNPPTTKSGVKSVIDSGLKTKRPLTVESANKGPTTELARREPSTASKIPRSPKTVRKSPPPVPVPVSVPVPISTDT